MALSEVLSAMREMILNWDEIPTDPAVRTKLLAEKFPKLSAAEKEDLAIIPSDKLKIYRSTIFTGESNIFVNHFKITLPLLAETWEKVRKTKFNKVNFTRLVHTLKPWQSQATSEILDNFAWVLEHKLTDLINDRPYLLDFAKLEAANVFIKRAIDPSIGGLDVAELSKLNVEQLLNLKLNILSSVRLEQFEFNVVNSFNSYYARQPRQFFAPEKEITFAVGYRNSNNAADWVVLDEKTYAALIELTGQQYIVADFFDRIIPSELQDPKIAFEYGLAALVSLLRLPVLQLH